VRQVGVYTVTDPSSIIKISGETLAFAGGVLTAASQSALADKDPRIDASSVTLVGNTLRFELDAWATDSGDVVVEDVSGVLAATNTSVETRYRDANEQRVYGLSTLLTTPGVISIAGEEITVSGDDNTLDGIAALINTNEARILERNPAIESVSAKVVAGNVELTVRYKAEQADIPNDLADDPYPVKVEGTTVFIDPAKSQDGDNSFMGYYRMYAYLNNEELLDIGKSQGPGSELTEPGPILIRFNPTNGLLREINGQAFTANAQVPAITIKGADPANDLTKISLDLTGATQFASSSIVKASQQDGYTKGDLIGVTFAGSGEMIASFSNGQNQALGVVALATFENQAGLQPSGDTEWIATLDSGDAIVNPPGTGLNGTLRSAALEASNVDLAEELVKLIEGQRNFQANSKTLETMNAITQNILQI
jgi:flagellar hook protein FlgE